MLEHMNQVVKHSALRNNFRNTLLTSSTRLAEKIAFDIYCGAHAGSNQVELEVSCVEECSQGTSPTIDHLIRLGVLRLATPDGTLEVKWLRKAKLSKSAFTPGDYVQTSTKASICTRYASTRSPMRIIARTCSRSRLITLSTAICFRIRISWRRRLNGVSRWRWRGECSISSNRFSGDRGGVFAFASH